MLCDRFAELRIGEEWDYQNILSDETNMTIDYALENFHNELYGKKINADKQIAPVKQLNQNKQIAPIGENVNTNNQQTKGENINWNEIQRPQDN